MHYRFEFGGGLGDIFYHFVLSGCASLLERLGSEDVVHITLVTHNPFAVELFDHHPCKKQIRTQVFDYWNPEQDEARRHELGLEQCINPALEVTYPLVFHPSSADRQIIRTLDYRRAIVIAASAGLADRTIPMSLLESICKLVKASGFTAVFVGRNYNRFGREEVVPSAWMGQDLVDKLTVPGVAYLVQKSAGLVCCHSAVNILGWLLQTPQLLLYPACVYEQHLRHRDQWSFGIDYSNTFASCFDANDGVPTAARFLKYVEGPFSEEICSDEHCTATNSAAMPRRKSESSKLKCRLLIIICSCQVNYCRRAAIRNSWLRLLANDSEYFFFVGSSEVQEDDVVNLNSGDDYCDLPAKVHSAILHALEHFEFERIFKCDDDTYVHLPRLEEFLMMEADLVGDDVPSRGWACGGAGYLLSPKAARALAGERVPRQGAEDVWVSSVVKSMALSEVQTARFQEYWNTVPDATNTQVTAHHCNGDVLNIVYNRLTGQRGGDLSFEASQFDTSWLYQGAITFYESGIYIRFGGAGNGEWEFTDSCRSLRLLPINESDLTFASDGVGYSSDNCGLILNPTIIFARFHAVHQDWEGPLVLFNNGLFTGGALNPNGRWRFLDYDTLILSWKAWAEDRLTREGRGFSNSYLRLLDF